MPHISLAAETLLVIAGFPITNSLLVTWIVMAMLVGLTFVVTRNLKVVPTPIQSIFEMFVGGLHNFFESIVGHANINKFFPLIASIFIFVLFGNWFGLLPGVGTIGIKDHGELIPIFRGPTADINTTLALALVSVFSIQYFGFQALGLGYLTKFLNFSNPIYFFIGILEIISEFSRIISFAFRLFGNIFAGEVLLTVIAFLMPIIAPLPFIGLEIFVGAVQALVFSMLTAVFLNMAIMSHDGH